MGTLFRRQAVILATSLSLVLLISIGAHFAQPQPQAHAQTVSRAALIGPKTYYLGLGDSLAFGYQPDFDWSHGYVQYFYNNLKQHGVSSLTDYGCNGETSNTMINGGCPYQFLLHNYYLGPQLAAAVNFLHSHAGQVSPVTLDMGANDLLPDINSSNCTVSANWTNDLAKLNSNMLNYILPQLVAALTNGSGQRTGDLVLTNYYDPYAKVCPNSLPYVQQLNASLVADAAQFNLPIADTYTAFGGANMANNICNYTWICSFFKDIHADDAGYQVIANAYAAKLGY